MFRTKAVEDKETHVLCSAHIYTFSVKASVTLGNLCTELASVKISCCMQV
jgi:hypothetical protein